MNFLPKIDWLCICEPNSVVKIFFRLTFSESESTLTQQMKFTWQSKRKKYPILWPRSEKKNFSKLTYDVIYEWWRHPTDSNGPDLSSEDDEDYFDAKIARFQIEKSDFDISNFMTSLWRHRTWSGSEKSSAQYKFAIDYDAKRIRSISLTSFEKKIQNCPSL